MILDVFLYAGELDMADLRVKTLRPHVDQMVAVSCRLTHQSQPAELVPPPDGCEWLIVDPDPIPEGRGGYGTPWYQFIERQQRNAMADAAQGCSANDLVLISDVDEIPNPSTLPVIAAAAALEPVAVPMRMHGFAIDYLYPTEWRGTTASLASDVAPQAHRDWRYRLPGVGHGWHLSWMGSLEEKRRKLESFSHAELSGLDLENCYQTGRHANGEVLTRLTDTEVYQLAWPRPITDRTFTIPASWWAPDEEG